MLRSVSIIPALGADRTDRRPVEHPFGAFGHKIRVGMASLARPMSAAPAPLRLGVFRRGRHPGTFYRVFG